MIAFKTKLVIILCFVKANDAEENIWQQFSPSLERLGELSKGASSPPSCLLPSNVSFSWGRSPNSEEAVGVRYIETPNFFATPAETHATTSQRNFILTRT